MGTKSMSGEEALDELVGLQDNGLILFEEGHELTPSNVWLEGWSPGTGAKETGNVAGVVVTYLGTGTLTLPVPARQASDPDALDARNAWPWCGSARGSGTPTASRLCITWASAEVASTSTGTPAPTATGRAAPWTSSASRAPSTRSPTA